MLYWKAKFSAKQAEKDGFELALKIDKLQPEG